MPSLKWEERDSSWDKCGIRATPPNAEISFSQPDDELLRLNIYVTEKEGTDGGEAHRAVLDEVLPGIRSRSQEARMSNPRAARWLYRSRCSSGFRKTSRNGEDLVGISAVPITINTNMIRLDRERLT